MVKFYMSAWSAVVPSNLIQQQSRCGCKGTSVGVTGIIHLLPFSERGHPGQSEWASYDKLEVLRAETEFPGEKRILPKNYRNLAYVFNLLTCPKDSRFKATTSTPVCWPAQWVSDLPASRNCVKQLLKQTIHTHIYTHAYTHIHTYTHTYTCIYTHIHTYTYIHTHTHIHIHTHTHIYARYLLILFVWKTLSDMEFKKISHLEQSVQYYNPSWRLGECCLILITM